jgi:2-methylisocitrate lyase-like PEP mutase family enzyme
LTQRSAVLFPGAANALGAKLISAVGFETFIVPGAGVSNISLGLPDLGFVNGTDLVNHVAMIRDSVDLPFLVDADTGFGNALNVYRTVRLLERVGANGIMLEDQVFPKRCGHFEGKEVIPREEMVQKIRAAVDARVDSQLVILARTDARAVNGLDDALDRAAAYREAGADALFVEAPVSLDEMAAIPKGVHGLHFANMVYGGRTPILNRQELARLGYAAVFCANAVLQAAMRSMLELLQHIKSKETLAGAEHLMVSFSERQDLLGMKFYEDLERRYRTGG